VEGLVRRLAALVFAVLLLSGAAAANSATAHPDFSKPYWLNYSLIFFEGCQPQVSAAEIVFTEGTCSVHAYEGAIFRRGTKVKIDSISEGPDGFKLRFKYWPEIYEFQNYHEVLLKSDAANVFRKPFKLLFSADKVPTEYRCPSHLKTKQHIIQCFGFPIEVTRDGATERYFYILEFVGPNRFYEFDGFWIKIKNGRFENISGYT